jgi:hypothetical protein
MKHILAFQLLDFILIEPVEFGIQVYVLRIF